MKFLPLLIADRDRCRRRCRRRRQRRDVAAAFAAAAGVAGAAATQFTVFLTLKKTHFKNIILENQNNNFCLRLAGEKRKSSRASMGNHRYSDQ